MNKQTRIMVTGAGALLGQGIIRSIKHSNFHPFIIGLDPSPYAPGLYWVDSSHIIPYASDSNYFDELIKIIKVEKPDIIMIGTDVELSLFAAKRRFLEDEFNTNVLVSDKRVVSIADDKFKTFEFLKKNGFSYPETCLPGDEDKLISKVGFPLIVKPRVGARSIDVSLVQDMKSLTNVLKSKKDFVIQEHVGSLSSEYTAGSLVFNGKCNASVVMNRELKDGNTYIAHSDIYAELNTQIKNLSEILNPHGPVNFQFRLDKNKVKVFEINARFSGTTPLRALVGFNEVLVSINWLINKKIIDQPNIKKASIMRYWSETIIDSEKIIDNNFDEE